MNQQARRRGLDLMPDPVEAVLPPVIGVPDLRAPPRGGEAVISSMRAVLPAGAWRLSQARCP